VKLVLHQHLEQYNADQPLSHDGQPWLDSFGVTYVGV
jgi:hypothetical protein